MTAIALTPVQADQLAKFVDGLNAVTSDTGVTLNPTTGALTFATTILGTLTTDVNGNFTITVKEA